MELGGLGYLTVVTNYTVTLRIIELIEIIQLIEYPVLFFVSLAVNLFFFDL